jgi:hypothetical protein
MGSFSCPLTTHTVHTMTHTAKRNRVERINSYRLTNALTITSHIATFVEKCVYYDPILARMTSDTLTG